MKKLVALIEPFAFDLGHPIAHLYMWYESYQKIMRWIGTVAGGMLTFTATFVLKDMIVLGSAGGIRMEVDSGAPVAHLALIDVRTLGVALLLLAGALVAVLLNLLVTYNWLVAGIKVSVHRLKPVMQETGLLDETLSREFRSYGAILSMRSWGIVSFILGGLAGALLLVGIGSYVAATWGLMHVLF